MTDVFAKWMEAIEEVERVLKPVREMLEQALKPGSELRRLAQAWPRIIERFTSSMRNPNCLRMCFRISATSESSSSIPHRIEMVSVKFACSATGIRSCLSGGTHPAKSLGVTSSSPGVVAWKWSIA